MMNKHLHLIKAIIALGLFFFVRNGFSQTTYIVTSTNIDGSGSFIEAIGLANNNPGADIIEFTPNLQVDAATATSGSADQYLIQITESVVINGNGAALLGRQSWITTTGALNNLNECPESNTSTLILAQMPNFLRVGTLGQDNSSINVTINDLQIEQFNQLARLEQNSKLTLDNFEAKDIWATLACNQKPLIDVATGASLNLLSSNFKGFKNWGIAGLGVISSEPSAGDLLIEDSYFYNLNDGFSFLISWNGQLGAKVNIISSRVIKSGALLLSGNSSVANFVNSTWSNETFEQPKFSERFINQSIADLNFIASSIIWNNYECDGDCQSAQSNGLDYYMFSRESSGMINFEESAIGFNVNSGTIPTLFDATSNGFSADLYTYIQATSAQDASTLQSITNQSNLLTNLSAFNSPIFTSSENQDFELLTPSFPGELIDVIPSTETLLHPITNNPIVLDVIGNDRFDANGSRDIGAIQLALAPLLYITNTGNQFVEITWHEPLHHDGDPIVRYEYQYAETSGGSPTIIDAGMSLTANIAPLANGTEYKFSVRAVYNESGNEVDGPFSNVELATPLTDQIPRPTLLATPGNEEVSLSWNSVDLGGRDFQFYSILWKLSGASSYIGGEAITDVNTTNTTISNLINGNEYEFSLQVVATNGNSSDFEINKAIPTATLFYPNPTRNILNINLKNDNYCVRLFSLDGKLILETENSKFINLSNISNGVYIVTIQTENRIYSGKILKD